MSESPSPALPRARVTSERRVSLAWVVPILAIIAVVVLVLAERRGPSATVYVSFVDGHGIAAGDSVRFRGIDVGTVETVRLDASGSGITVSLRIDESSDLFTRPQTRYWIVRPEIGLAGVAGLETLVGPRYVAVRPGVAGDVIRSFDGLEEPPVVEATAPNDLEIVLEAARRGGLRRGAPVQYRQIPIGSVRSVGLSTDSRCVEARVHIAAPYRSLVRTNTQFWDAGGAQADIGLTGISLRIDSIADLLVGGIALATPPGDAGGAEVRTGHRFVLAEEAEDDWLAWTPAVPIGSDLLPGGAPRPVPQRTTLRWRGGFIIKGARSRGGWALATQAGLLGPADVLAPNDLDADQAPQLELSGMAIALPAPTRVNERLAMLPFDIDRLAWPTTLVGAPAGVGDWLAFGDPASAPLALAADRMTPADGVFIVADSVPVEPGWHGAPVVDRASGRVVGVLVIEDEAALVAPIPERWADQ